MALAFMIENEKTENSMVGRVRFIFFAVSMFGQAYVDG